MTRRVRFTPLLAAGVFVAALGSARAGDVPFVVAASVPDGPTSSAEQVLADLDRDGDLDVALAAWQKGVIWLENVDGAGITWTTRTISTALNSPQGVTTGDLDRDGDLDVAIASRLDGRITWFENTSGNGSAWALRTVSTNAPNARAIAVGDLDGDADLDLAYATGFAAGVAATGWFENLGGGSTWTPHPISTQAGTYSVRPADVDGDGDLDLVSPRFWQRNVAGDGSSWTTHAFPNAPNFPTRLGSPADIDRDGDMDVLVVSGLTPRPTWLENVTGDGMSWALHPLDQALPGTFGGTAADVDGDGDVDALLHESDNYGRYLAWFENTTGNGAAWVRRPIPAGIVARDSLVTGDLDGDGDLDAAATSFTGTLFAWYRNETLHGNACFVVRTVSTASSTRTVAMADVDRDGDPDVVAASSIQARLNWYENVGGAGTAWAAHTIATDEVRHLVMGDVDGDGDADVVAAPQASLLVYWYENAAGGRSWTRRTLALPPASGVEMVAVADFSGDGDLDLAVAGPAGQTRLWSFENAAGDGTSWILGTVSATLGHRALNVADVDRDGNVDILAHGMPPTGPTLTWFENSPGNAWFPHFAGGPASAAYRVLAADLDGDADVDLVDPADESPGQGINWRENLGSGNAWTTHSLQESGYDAEAGDFDRDGDQDLVTSRDTSSGLELFENTNGDASVWARHVLTTLFHSSPSLARGDVDRDGDADLLAILGLRARWLENRGGQLDLAVTSILQAGPGNGDVVPMLRAVVTHLGRAGEPPLELASLGLRFATAEGTAYTTAQANAFVESLRVHRDSNGNGVFDPGLDALVANVVDLSLDPAGVQTIAFTDGDPAVAVEQGTPRAFFVVLELTAAASGQVPGTLRLVLVQEGPSALVAEDLVHDIPLRLACPRDAGTTIRYVVPVELTGFSVE